jgi:peptidoglycan/LPS O-acetylase OafA/YrhL
MTERLSRLHELDSLRALAAIGVVGWHYTNHFGAAPFHTLMLPFYRYGLILVDFFFVLSGFVLARTYWTDDRSGRFALNLRDRIARIYPLHLTTLLFVALMQWVLVHKLRSAPFIYHFNDKQDFVLNLLLLNMTGLERGFSFNAPAWSISTEFVINIIFLLSITLSRTAAKTMLTLLFLISLGVVLRNGLIAHASFVYIDNDIFRTALGFTVGIATNRLNETNGNLLNSKPGVADTMAVASVISILYYCAKGQFGMLGNLTMDMLCFPTLILGVIHGRFIKSLLLLKPLVYMGMISYSIYLVHFPLQLAVHLVSIATNVEMPYDHSYFLVGFLLTTIALASFTYRFIELPGKKLLRKLPVGPRGAPATMKS